MCTLSGSVSPVSPGTFYTPPSTERKEPLEEKKEPSTSPITWRLEKTHISSDPTTKLTEFSLKLKPDISELTPDYIKNTFITSEKALENLKSFAAQPYPDECVTSIITIFDKQIQGMKSLPEGPLSRLLLVFKIFCGLTSAPLSKFEKSPQKKVHLLSMALFCENLPKEAPHGRPRYFPRNATKLDNPIIYVPEDQSIVISAGKHNSTLQGKGSIKVVRSALRFRLTHPGLVDVVARLFTKLSVIKDSYSYLQMLKEIDSYIRLKELPGIVQILGGVEVNVLKDIEKNTWTKRVEVVFEWLETDLEKIIDKPHDFPNLDFINNKMLFARECINGLVSLHKRGYIHYDLKPGNLLASESANPAEKITVKIGDLAYAVKVTNGTPPPKEICPIFHEGYYGTPEYTAPELFGVQDFKNDYFKLDVWALGVTLYCIRYTKLPPWSNTLGKSYTTLEKNTKAHIPLDLKELKKAQTEVRSSIQSEIENHEYYKHYLNKKAQGKKLTADQELSLLIYSMLRLNPDDRYTIAQAKAEIDRIFMPDKK